MTPTVPLWIICGLITIGAIFYVFFLPGELHVGAKKSRLAFLRERKEVVYENLRDLSFEHTAGKFPDSDYEVMKASLEQEAASILAEMARIEEGGAMTSVSIPKKGARV